MPCTKHQIHPVETVDPNQILLTLVVSFPKKSSLVPGETPNRLLLLFDAVPLRVFPLTGKSMEFDLQRITHSTTHQTHTLEVSGLRARVSCRGGSPAILVDVGAAEDRQALRWLLMGDLCKESTGTCRWR